MPHTKELALHDCDYIKVEMTELVNDNRLVEWVGLWVEGSD
jgi:hypothetical protein